MIPVEKEPVRLSQILIIGLFQLDYLLSSGRYLADGRYIHPIFQ